jgi:hypothetical protein
MIRMRIRRRRRKIACYELVADIIPKPPFHTPLTQGMGPRTPIPSSREPTINIRRPVMSCGGAPFLVVIASY